MPATTVGISNYDQLVGDYKSPILQPWAAAVVKRMGEISLSGAVRPVAQTSARLKEAAKLGFGRAVLPESARGDVGGDAGLSLNTVGGLTSLVADIAARGSPRGAKEGSREGAAEKNATPARFRRENG